MAVVHCRSVDNAFYILLIKSCALGLDVQVARTRVHVTKSRMGVYHDYNMEVSPVNVNILHSVGEYSVTATTRLHATPIFKSCRVTR